jgi:hypothetical protein
MADIPDKSEYWAVECDECDEWIAIRPASRVDDILIDPTVPFPAKFTVAGHEHGIFLASEVFPKVLSHKHTSQLPKITPVK